MCQHDLLSPDNRDASLGRSVDVEWDATSDKSFVITYKGGDMVDDKKERYGREYQLYARFTCY